MANKGNNMRSRGLRLWLATAFWLIALFSGIVFLIHYAGIPGKNAAASQLEWPAGTALNRPKNKPVLLVFAHPRCSCSAATVGELDRLMLFLKDKVDVKVLFIQPEEKSPSWVQGSLWEKARAIPGVEVLADPNGKEIDLFAAKTSGQTLLYDTDGSLIFSGGITAARGHMGDSRGRAFIISWLDGKEKSNLITPVFGCALKKGALFQDSSERL